MTEYKILRKPHTATIKMILDSSINSVCASGNISCRFNSLFLTKLKTCNDACIDAFYIHLARKQIAVAKSTRESSRSNVNYLCYDL